MFHCSTLTFLSLAAVALPAKASSAVPPDFAVERYRLSNGLEVLLHQDTQIPVVHVEVWYKVGSKDEPPGKTGIAHLLEHMMFEGTKHIPAGSFFKYLARAGASRHNGATDTDRTRYYETVPASQLERILWLESSRMGFLLEQPSLAESLAKQREVVKNERRQDVENTPLGGVDRLEREALFPVGHPYRHEVIGSTDDIEGTTVADLRRFFDRYYGPNNAILLLAGNFDNSLAKELIQKYFGPISGGPTIPKPQLPPVSPAEAEQRIDMEAKINLPQGRMAWTTVPAFAAGEAELDALATLLAGDPSSRLYNRLVTRMRIAESVSATHTGGALGGIFEIDFTAMKGHSLAEIEKVIDEELAKLQTQLASADEVERARNQIQADLLGGMADLAGLSERLLTYDVLAGDPGFLGRDLRRYDQITPDSLQVWAKRILGRNSRVSIDVEPYARAPVMGRLTTPVAFESPGSPTPDLGTQSATPEGPFRSSPDSPFRWIFPPPLEVRPFHVAAAKRFRLSNGLPVILVESHELPIFDVAVTVKAGNAADPPYKAGLASLVADLLDEGTNKHTGIQIAKQLAQLGASVSAEASWDASTVSLETPASHRDRALAIWAEVLLSPVFLEEDRERVVNRWLALIDERRDHPGAIADHVFDRALWGDRDPFAWPLLGSEDSIRNIRRQDLKDFYTAFYAPNNAVLTVSGDITEKEVRNAIEPLLAAWKARPLPPVDLRRMDPPPGARMFLVDRPGASQSSIRMGLPGIERKNPDYYRALVTNQILGGPFKRLEANLREAKGWTYEIGSRFEARRSQGPWMVSGELTAAHTADGVAEVLGELRRLSREDVSADELADAKKELVGAFMARFTSASSTAEALTGLAVYDLPAKELDGFIKKIEAVDASQVRKTAQRYLRSEDLLTVVVGDRRRTEASLQKIGPVELLDVNGAPARRSSAARSPAATASGDAP